MKRIIFVLSMIMGLDAIAGEVPEKFQNPVFNDILYSGGNKSFSHDIKVTPTGIKDYDNEYGDETCEYIVEDEKGFLLKCTDIHDGYELYEMFYARYQVDFTNIGGDKECSVWNCVFDVENGKIVGLGTNAPTSHSSKVYNCAGEKDRWKDFKYSGPKMNCLDELKERGWEKYIPGKWEKKVNTWQH